MSTEEMEEIKKALQKIVDDLNRKTEALWLRVNSNTDRANELLNETRLSTALQRDMNITLREIHRNLQGEGDELGLRTRVILLEESEKNRKWHIRAIWTAISSAIIGWMATKLGL